MRYYADNGFLFYMSCLAAPEESTQLDLQLIHIDVENRSDEQSDQLGKDQTAHHAQPEGPA